MERKRRSDAEIDIEKAVELRIHNKLSYAEIGRVLAPKGRAPFTAIGIQKAISKQLPEEYRGRDFAMESLKDRRSKTLEVKHQMSLDAITEEKLDTSSAKDNAMVSKLLYEQLRLENNQSTNNVAVSFANLVEGSMSEDGM